MLNATTRANHAIGASELARRLAAGEPVTVLDVRDADSEAISGASVSTLRVDPQRALAEPEAYAGELRGADGTPVVVCNRGVTARPVAEALRASGVDALVLEGGVRAWLGALQAHRVELGVPGLEVRQVQRPGRGCLSYVLASDGEALVVDPAPDAEFYVALARELGAQVTQVFDTHLHADHLSGARDLAELTGAHLLLPDGSLERGVAYAEQVTPLRDGDALTVGRVTARVLALPGHTTDMTGLLVADRALLSGDSLFAEGVARPDLERRDRDGARAMAGTLHETLQRILALPGETILLPGHDRAGVRGGAVAPTLAEVRRAVPELAFERERFVAAAADDLPPRPANFMDVIAVNSGLRPADPELEQGDNSCAIR
jgi:glyoxylase-like metal-dependent hydrolase (beta-lactamase superfamily II)/rhodanese-related sulfurtransferase